MPAEPVWPPPGVSVVLEFKPPTGSLEGLVVRVHYELYDGIPLICKWLTLENDGPRPGAAHRVYQRDTGRG